LLQVKLNGKIVMNMIILILAVFVLYMSSLLPSQSGLMELGPSFYPRIVACALILLTIIQAILDLVVNRTKENTVTIKWGRVLGLSLIMITYIYVLPWIGYKIGSFVLMTSIMMLLGVRGHRLIVIPIIVIGVVYLVFQYFLKTPLP